MKQISRIVTADTLMKSIKFENMEKAEKELTVLYGRRYLQYRKNWQMAGEFKYEPEFPLYIMLEQTYRCNMRCVSCIHGYPHLRNKFSFKETQMPRELFEQVVLEGEENNCPSLSMHNNDEPLLVRNIEKRINFARKHGFMDIIITTNGISFTDERIKAVIDAGVTRILFSIDAVTEETYNRVRPGGNFNEVLSAMERTKTYRDSLRSHLPILRASFVVNRFNQHELNQFLDRFSAWVDYLEVQPFCTWYDTNSDLIPKGAKQITNFYCDGPWRVLVVRGNGEVLPCPSFYGTEVVIGNIYKETLKKIFNSPLMKKIRRDFKKGYYRFPTCKKCSRSIYMIDLREDQ